MEIFNNYSMLWSVGFILSAGVIYIMRKGYNPKDALILLGIGAILLVVWLFIRPQQASTDDFVQFQDELGQGLPVLLEMKSPY